MRSKFKDEHPFEKRKAEAERIVRLPVVVIPLTCVIAERSLCATMST